MPDHDDPLDRAADHLRNILDCPTDDGGYHHDAIIDAEREHIALYERAAADHDRATWTGDLFVEHEYLHSVAAPFFGIHAARLRVFHQRHGCNRDAHLGPRPPRHRG